MESSELRSVLERLRAAVRESVKGADQSKFLTAIDALEKDLLSPARDPVTVRSHLQHMRDTSRRTLRTTPQAMTRMLKSVDGVDEDLQKILDSLGGKS
jgi:hypothetical protein